MPMAVVDVIAKCPQARRANDMSTWKCMLRRPDQTGIARRVAHELEQHVSDKEHTEWTCRGHWNTCLFSSTTAAEERGKHGLVDFRSHLFAHIRWHSVGHLGVVFVDQSLDLAVDPRCPGLAKQRRIDGWLKITCVDLSQSDLVTLNPLVSLSAMIRVPRLSRIASGALPFSCPDLTLVQRPA